MSRGQANVIRAFCLWTVYVWVTRIWNIWGDETRDGAFKAVHTVICVISIAFAVAAWVVVSKVRRSALARSTAAGGLAADPRRTAGATRESAD